LRAQYVESMAASEDGQKEMIVLPDSFFGAVGVPSKPFRR
jgi:hypothetical protein